MIGYVRTHQKEDFEFKERNNRLTALHWVGISYDQTHGKESDWAKIIYDQTHGKDSNWAGISYDQAHGRE